jgi:hypothetical protein
MAVEYDDTIEMLKQATLRVPEALSELAQRDPEHLAAYRKLVKDVAEIRRRGLSVAMPKT